MQSLISGVGRPQLALELDAVRTSEGRWPRICEERRATRATEARCRCVF